MVSLMNIGRVLTFICVCNYINECTGGEPPCKAREVIIEINGTPTNRLLAVHRCSGTNGGHNVYHRCVQTEYENISINVNGKTHTYRNHTQCGIRCNKKCVNRICEFGQITNCNKKTKDDKMIDLRQLVCPKEKEYDFIPDCETESSFNVETCKCEPDTCPPTQPLKKKTCLSVGVAVMVFFFVLMIIITIGASISLYLVTKYKSKYRSVRRVRAESVSCGGGGGDSGVFMTRLEHSYSSSRGRQENVARGWTNMLPWQKNIVFSSR